MKSFKKFLGFTLASAMLVACSGKDEKAATAEAEQEAAPMVNVLQVSEQEVPNIKEYTATVEAYKTNNITTSTPNRIKKILVDVGSNVRAGQTLVVLDDVNIAQAEIRLADVKRNYDRAVELLNIGGGTQMSVDQIKTEYDAAVRALRNMKENAVLTSPISGVVTARNYDGGDMTGQLPILVVEQQQPLKVVLNVSESEYPLVKMGMPVTVKLDVYGDEEFQGKVSQIAPSVDVNSRTFAVEVTITNTGNRIRTGMFARVIINYGTKINVVVPDQAVVKQTGSGVRYVYVLKGDVAEYREVELGSRLDNKYELLSGVENGETVITSGQTRITNGSKVQVVKDGEVSKPAAAPADSTKTEASK